MDIYLEKLQLVDFNEYYQIRCEKENIYWTGYIKPPKKNKLLDWYTEQLQKHNRLALSIKSKQHNNKLIGYIYIDIDDKNENTIILSYSISTKYTGRGIGTKAISLAMKYCKNNLRNITKLDAWVLHNNIRSIKCFLKNNWIELDEYKEIFFEPLNKTIIMKKYVHFIDRTCFEDRNTTLQEN